VVALFGLLNVSVPIINTAEEFIIRTVHPAKKKQIDFHQRLQFRAI
jgi:hypothetical protein